MIRILIAASSAIVRAGLETLVQSSPSIQVVGSAPDLNGLTTKLNELHPDLLLAEVEGAEDESSPELVELAMSADAPAIVLIADDSSAPWTAEALRAGVRAVLPRELMATEIVAAIEAVAAGLVVLHPQNLSGLLPSPLPLPASSARAQSLTPRELEVLRMIADGLSNKAIAWRLSISEHTVKFHVESIMTKLNAGSRTEAVTTGIRRGLILL